jgi:hypothetical protein
MRDSRPWRRGALAVLVVVVVLATAACSSSDGGGDGRVTGVVTQVSGELGEVASFVVTDGEGKSYQFEPAPGLTFEEGPLDHLREHIVSGDPVEVAYERSPEGVLVAIRVTDA